MLEVGWTEEEDTSNDLAINPDTGAIKVRHLHLHLHLHLHINMHRFRWPAPCVLSYRIKETFNKVHETKAILG